MEETLLNVSLTRTRSVRHQIEEQVREMILSGQLAAGVKLPSTHELAQSWDTHSPTVHAALQPLVREGLITRSHRTGTFVREREEKLTCVGVYCGAPARQAPYLHMVQEALREELHKIGVAMDLWTDLRPSDQHDGPWKPLIKAAEQRQFQAFIGIGPNVPMIQWQRKLPVPVAFLGGTPATPNRVAEDIVQMVEIGLRELARQGCRSVGLIVPTSPEGNPDGSRPETLDMLDHFLAVAADLKLTVKNGWMRVPRFESLQGRTQEQYGYDEFLKLWSQPEKPEGLFVAPDSVARGVILGVREQQVKVPQQLKLVFHKNESIDLVCPMPATFVVGSEREAARALIEQLQKQFRGESCEPISLPFKLAAHNNLNK